MASGETDYTELVRAEQTFPAVALYDPEWGVFDPVDVLILRTDPSVLTALDLVRARAARKAELNATIEAALWIGELTDRLVSGKDMTEPIPY